jgi:hypothetical protein
MNQSSKDSGRPLIPHHEPAEGLEPRVRPLDDPSAPVPPQLAPVLMRRHPVVAPGRDDRIDVALHEQRPQRVGVVAAVGDQPLRLTPLSAAASDAPVLKGLFKQFHLRGGSRLHVYSERSTRAIGQYHELRSLAALGLPDQRALFLR